MKTTYLQRGWLTMSAAILFGGLLLLPAGDAFGQAAAPSAPAAEATDETATDDAPAADTLELNATDSAQPADSTAAQDAAATAPAQSAEAPATPAPAPPTDVAAVSENAAENASGLGPIQLGLIVLALFVLPIVVGNFLANQLRMPDYAWKISLVLGSLAISLVILAFGEFKGGPDLAGGITLIYELADTSAPPAEGQAPAPEGEQPDEAAAKPPERNFTMSEVIDAIKKRIDPTGTREVTIREYGPAIEIIIPKTGQDALDYVKRRVTELGQLEFRITASEKQSDEERRIVEQALMLPLNQKELFVGDSRKAEWIAYSPEEFGAPDQPDPSGERSIIKRMAGDTPEVLVLIDPMNVTGDYLTSVSKGVSDVGGPAVNFRFDSQGARRFRQLTSQNLPNRATNVHRFLGIVLDKRLVSAPAINDIISNDGQISGRGMKEDEVDHVISILQAGKLPAALNKMPISEEVISPTLGAVTVQKGKYAIGISMLAVVAFMMVYYRWAGVVACIVLTLNLLLVLAVMVLIKAAFTLPGLAGLVLTIGMSVDANVLIFERIREELRNGAALRMAIRNGFGRAMSAIIDSNVTTIITGLVLYAIGTDQIKGFAVTLILGILTSMFTAIFCARLIFDIAERRGWIKSLSMMQFLGETHYDFLRMRHVAIGASAALIAIGMFAIFGRGTQLLDIDFTGGSSVTFALKEADKMPIGEVRTALVETPLGEENLVVVERGETQTRYTVDTSDQSVDQVKETIVNKFGDKLLSFSVDVAALSPFDEGGVSGTEAKLSINKGADYDDGDGVSYDALMERLRTAIREQGHQGIMPSLNNPNYRTGSGARYNEWTVRLGGLDQSAAQGVLDRLESDLEGVPLFPLASKIGGRVSGNMQAQALYAIVISLIGVIAYLWLRFQKVSYGLAAATAVAHDALITLSMLALSSYIVSGVPALADVLQIDSFQINLVIVAALLTIIGYSLNDTIVTFDRLREIKGKSPKLTADMVNLAVNQTLSRTILTALTVLMVVVILYFFGGDGIHGFAFAFLIGIVAGTYSTVYIAAPVLLWLSGASLESTPVVERQPPAMEPVAR